MPNILVVEDSPAMRNLIASVLDEIPESRVDEASSGVSALKKLPRSDFDLVVMDINMPGVNGLELLSFMRKNPKYVSTPVLVVSTESSAEDRRRALELGANDYLTKPFSNDALRTLAQELLEA